MKRSSIAAAAVLALLSMTDATADTWRSRSAFETGIAQCDDRFLWTCDRRGWRIIDETAPRRPTRRSRHR